jgi:serine/threonine-protein kinase
MITVVKEPGARTTLALVPDRLYRREVRVVCPACDQEPPPGTPARALCPSCGAQLVQIQLDDEEHLIGTVVDGRFEIVGVLGKGGMGLVYRAIQRSIGREVALKMMDRRFDRDLASVKRFLREAKTASQLSHPNTVGVIEFGQSQDGRLYLAMELVRGRTLLEVIESEGALALPRVLRIGVQLCDALDAAHALSIVHRDLKLENVMLLDGTGERDLIKVLDFGLARSIVDADARATATGVISGTPRCMPPEVAFEAAPPAPAQDLYALGVMLGELSVGRFLWEAPTLQELFTQKLQGSPLLQSVDPRLKQIIVQLLDTQPGARPAAAVVRRGLLVLESAPPPQEPEAPPTEPDIFPLYATNAKVNAPVFSLPEKLALAPAGGLLHPDGEPSIPLAVEESESAALAPSAFAPPSEPEVKIAIDIASQSPPRSPAWPATRPPSVRPASSSWAGALVALLIFGGTGGLYLAFRGHKPVAGWGASDEPVSIEIRGLPDAVIRVDDEELGMPPITIQRPNSRTPIEIEAEFDGRLVKRKVVPDRNQTIDFTP